MLWINVNGIIGKKDCLTKATEVLGVEEAFVRQNLSFDKTVVIKLENRKHLGKLT